MKLKRCRTCGDDLPETRDNFYRNPHCVGGLENICIPCRREKNKIQQRTYTKDGTNARQKRERRANCSTSAYLFVVVSDPDPDGFPRGAEFPRAQVTLDLKAGNYTPGMLMADRGRTYRVDMLDGYEQRLVEVMT